MDFSVSLSCAAQFVFVDPSRPSSTRRVSQFASRSQDWFVLSSCFIEVIILIIVDWRGGGSLPFQGWQPPRPHARDRSVMGIINFLTGKPFPSALLISPCPSYFFHVCNRWLQHPRAQSSRVNWWPCVDVLCCHAHQGRPCFCLSLF